MSKQKKQALAITRKDDLGMNYLKSLENESKYQITVDPDNIYDMSAEHKKFVELFVQYRNLAVVAELMSIEPVLAKDYFTRYSTQQEIRRINSAFYHRQVATNIIAFEDIGSYLSSWLIGSDITEADRLKKGEKLQVVKLLMDWHKSMREIIQAPEIITIQTIEDEIKELSVANIKQLLTTKSILKTNEEKKLSKPQFNSDDKDELIAQLNEDNMLSKEELEYLETLSVKDLLSLLKDEVWLWNKQNII